MAEVRVKIGADIKDLQKGVRDSQKELGNLARDAKQASGVLSLTGKSLEQIKADAQKAIQASQEFRASMENATAASTRFAGVLKGGLFLGAVAASADYLGTRLVEAFTKGKRAAEEAGKVFAKALPGAVQFSTGSDPFQARSRDDILAVFRDAETEVRRLDALIQESQGGILKQGLTFVRAFLDPQAKTQQQVVAALMAQRAEQQSIADAAGEAFKQYEAQQRIARSLADLGLETKSAIEGQAAALKEVRRSEEELLRLRAAANAAVGAPTPFVQRGGGSTAVALPDRPDKVFDESAIDAQIARQEALNTQLAAGNDLFTQFGVSGAAALADIALGFEKLETLADSVQNIVRGLVREIALAAAKAAILNVLFPGAGAAAGGFKGLFKSFIGLPTGSAPSFGASLADRPAAVAPLGRLAQASGTVEVMIPELAIRGNDLVVAFQRARTGMKRTTGNIPLE